MAYNWARLDFTAVAWVSSGLRKVFGRSCNQRGIPTSFSIPILYRFLGSGFVPQRRHSEHRHLCVCV